MDESHAPPGRGEGVKNGSTAGDSTVDGSHAVGATSQAVDVVANEDPDVPGTPDAASGTIFDGLVRTPDKKAKRQSYTNAQKAALRARARTEPSLTQTQLAEWFLQQFGVRINQSSLSLTLAESRTDLDSEEAANSQTRKHKLSQFPELEALLSREQRQLEEQGVHVTSSMLKQAGKRLWSEMDIYQDKPVPAFSNGWLAGFKARHAVPGREKKRRTELAASLPQTGPSTHPPIVSTSPTGPSEHPATASTSPNAPKKHPTTVSISPAAPSTHPPIVSTSPTGPSEHPATVSVSPNAPKRNPPFLYHPRPAYQAREGSLLRVDRDLYSRIAATASGNARVLTAKHLIPPRSGYAWSVPAGHIVRITTPRGPQVGDLNVWNLHNPRERFWAARTRQLHASHVGLFDRLWSCLPYLRPLVTITGDSLSGYGVDAQGGRCHDLLGTRCDPYVRKMLTRGIDGADGEEFDFHCHSNLTRAVLPWGLSEADVHDVLNVFQVTGLDLNGRYFMAPCPALGGSSVHDEEAQQEGWTDKASGNSHAQASSPAQPGSDPQREADYLEFFAEIDVLCALSACPGGDLSSWEWGNEDAMRRTCRPLGVEVYKIAEHEQAEVLRGWTSPRISDYKGRHGMHVPRGEAVS